MKIRPAVSPQRPATTGEKVIPEHRPGELVLKMRGEIEGESLEQLRLRVGVKSMEELPIPLTMRESIGGIKGAFYHVKLLPGVSMEDGIRRASGAPSVEYAEPNYIYHGGPVRRRDTVVVSGGAADRRAAEERIPNDLDRRLWGLKNTGQTGGTPGADIHAPEAWAITTGTADGPIVAVVDTGVDYTHPELKNNIWTNPGEIPGNGIDDDGNGVVDDVHGYNAVDGSGNPMDDNDHGTHVSGTIAAEGDNGRGIVGVNWRAPIMGCKFLDGGGSGTLADAIKAIGYAAKMKARFTSNSWGGGGYSQALYEALRAFPGLHIFAAGNESNDSDVNPAYPAAYDLPNIVSVAASDHKDELADFSNWGKSTVDLAAPGVDIYSTIPGGRFASFDGTSMATPHVTGSARLILSKYSNATDAQIKDRLLNTVDPIPAFKEKMVSGGRLNVARALASDEAPPAVPGEFRAEQVGAMSATLAWIAPGDDGNEGRASRYELRMADRPIVDGVPGDGEIGFEAAAPVDIPAPQPAGSAESAKVSLPPAAESKVHYFALKAVDKLGNRSGMAGTSATTKPAGVVFEDDGEEDGKWTAEGSWGREEYPGRGKVWSDSPGGAYQDNANMSLTSIPIPLGSVLSPVLYFSERHDLEPRYDKVHLEISKDDGQSWKEHLVLGETSDWQTRRVDLAEYEGGTIRIRFRLTSDSSVVKDGIQLDNIFVAGEPKE